MTTYGLEQTSRFFKAASSLALLLAVSLAVAYLAGGKLRWDTQLFARGHGWLSLLFFGLALLVFLRNVSSPLWDAFSPLRLFYTLWFGVLAVGCLQLTTAEAPFTVRFWATVASGLTAFYLGSYLAHRKRLSEEHTALVEMPNRWTIDWSPARTLWVAVLLCAMCLSAFVYAYLHAGTFPLLTENPEAARFEFGVNSYLARLVVSFYIVVQLGYLGVFHLRKYRAAFLVLILIAGSAITLITARFFLLIAIWTAIVFFHYGRRRMTAKVAIITVLIAYPLAKVAVDVKRFYENPAYAGLLDKIDFPENLRSVAPDYLYFAMTLQTLDHLTFTIPNEVGYQHGWYSAYPLRVFWTPRQGEGFRDRLDDLFWERSLEWSPVQAVTTSYMGVPYADFGIPGVFIFSLIFGWIALRLYDSMRSQPTFWRVFLYSVVSFGIVLSIYGNYLTLFDLYWNILLMALVNYFVSSKPAFANQGAAGQLAMGS